MADVGYVWDESKYEEVQREHDVYFSEVLQVFEDPNALMVPDPQGNWEREMGVGCTWAGRLLQVLYTAEDYPLIRIITAFEGNKHWRREYEQAREPSGEGAS